jgi:hypothetical protein
MRKIVFISVLALFVFPGLQTGLAFVNLPDLNQKIVEYVETVIGQQVDRGECWDLAFQALTRNNAKWDGQYKYGKEYNVKREKVLPGDIIQFKDVKVQYREGNTIYTETMAHHTAIVYKVSEDGVLELAHQNTGFSGRTVGLSKLDLSTVKSGRMWFYRPVTK